MGRFTWPTEHPVKTTGNSRIRSRFAIHSPRDGSGLQADGKEILRTLKTSERNSNWLFRRVRRQYQRPCGVSHANHFARAKVRDGLLADALRCRKAHRNI